MVTSFNLINRFIIRMNFTKLLIFASLLVSLRASMSLIKFPKKQQVSVDNLTCLSQKGYIDQLFIDVYQYTSFQSSVQFSQLNKASIVPHIVLYPFYFEYYSPDQSVSKWTTILSKYTYNSLWIGFVQSDYKIDCQDLLKFVIGLKQSLKKDVGIAINQQLWKNELTNAHACMQLSFAPLFYQNKTEFEPFGAWDNWKLKEGKESLNVCGVQSIVEVLSN